MGAGPRAEAPAVTVGLLHAAVDGRERDSRPPRAAVAAVLLAAALAGCGGREAVLPSGPPFVVVLGIAQDGGFPQIACRGACCREASGDPARRRHVASLGIVDPVSGDRYLVDATPDLREQIQMLDRAAPVPAGHGIGGILLTHAHAGHYTGLALLGREALGTWEVPVWVMPRMRRFLSSNGPWDQLVRLKNVDLRPLEAGKAVRLTPRLTVTPLPVPHRDEYSETVGFRIAGPERAVLYIPDIDRWDLWDLPLEEALRDVDAAFLDGTFYTGGELPGRDPAEVPHPPLAETMARLAALPEVERAKVRFVHLNHTNPALDPGSDAARAIRDAGFAVAAEGEQVPL